ncbi:MAG: N-6 DNA methylase [Candidatus Accumulibacter sp.]|nr:N-6 DNA methylase [Accumulibacter sp.]
MTTEWLDALGYTPGDVVTRSEGVAPSHPYAREIGMLLDPKGEIGASAVFEIDRVPTVCFVEAASGQVANGDWIDSIRQKIWNQNLVSIVLVLTPDSALPFPVQKDVEPAGALALKAASTEGPFSAIDIASGDIQKRHPSWFSLEGRVDRNLLKNLSIAVGRLKSLEIAPGEALGLDQAQLLLGQCMFVSYLEHRGMVSDAYRQRRGVGELRALVKARDHAGLGELFRQLKHDFNGDLLESEVDAVRCWLSLPDQALELIRQFLDYADMEVGQESLWHYDFRYIPVELISGIYETFLAEEHKDKGAFYTPRHLANLAVDEAFAGSADIASEVVFDGACGSGILLTTAFRRMVGAASGKAGRDLEFLERKDLLMRGIRGGDISKAACRVAAFSLYLALLEDLRPSDIARLCDDQNVKLPPLLDDILVHGDKKGDFFSPDNPLAKPGAFTILISNPPWFEPKVSDRDLPYETWWAENFSRDLGKRQIAEAYAFRATELAAPGARLCLILPIGLFYAHGGTDMLDDWVRLVRAEKVYNFADLRWFLFPGAVHPSMVVTGVRKGQEESGSIDPRETFQYLVPKADVSLAFGRLTIHGSDRHTIYATDAAASNEVLRTYLWGSNEDQGLINRLRRKGRLKHMLDGKTPRLVMCKGFHVTDRSKPPVSPAPLQHLRFLSTERGKSRFPKDLPVIEDQLLDSFPTKYTTVSDYGSRDSKAFDGPRVLFPDGADSNTLQIRAAFAAIPFCFTQTVTAIVGEERDADLLRFLTVFLRSRLASYLLFYTAYSSVVERPHVKMVEIKELPFYPPENHADPKAARRIVASVAAKMRRLEQADLFEAKALYARYQQEFEHAVSAYFGLSKSEEQAVQDTCDVLIPSMQPQTEAAIRTRQYELPAEAELQRYQALLTDELASWRESLGGQGKFVVESFHQNLGTPGGIGIVRLSMVHEGAQAATPSAGPVVLDQLFRSLKEAGILPLTHTNGLSYATDYVIHDGPYIYLIKPLIRRLWLAPQCIRDARRIVLSVREASGS